MDLKAFKNSFNTSRLILFGVPAILLLFIVCYFKSFVSSTPDWFATEYTSIFPQSDSLNKQASSTIEQMNKFVRDPPTTGQIGDTFGGTLGPIIAVFAAYLTFLAFWIQFWANEQQRRDIRIERFENKFYEMLRLHKENLHETSIGGYDGKKVELRKAFVSMYKEFRYCYVVTKLEYDRLKINGCNMEYSDENLVKLAYIFFYAGVGIHSDILSNEMIGDKYNDNLVCCVRKYLTEIHKNHKSLKADNKVPILKHKDVGDAMLPKSYRPFGGHMSRLGHYYRHLFQAVKFVVKQPNKLIDREAKLEYLRTLRAQISDHEQVMLYYNALAKFGEEWIINDYFTEYKMIHNIPLPLARFGMSPEEKFEEYIKKHGNIFEWYD